VEIKEAYGEDGSPTADLMDIRTPHPERIFFFVYLRYQHSSRYSMGDYAQNDWIWSFTHNFAKVLSLLPVPPAERFAGLERDIGQLRVAVHWRRSADYPTHNLFIIQ
jgi:hypothetical protein